MHKGFAVPPLNHLGTSPLGVGIVPWVRGMVGGSGLGTGSSRVINLFFVVVKMSEVNSGTPLPLPEGERRASSQEEPLAVN
jgi:hypothetical protein